MKIKSNALIILSAVAAIISGLVSLGSTDFLKLAGTQWMLIAIVMGIYALYSKK